MKTKEIKDLVRHNFAYAKQSSAPSWYSEAEEKDIGLTACATFGSSKSNEWYLFKDRSQALECIRTFDSQTFLDSFAFGQDGEIYDLDDFVYVGESDEVLLHLEATPASLGSVVFAESCF